MSTWTPDDDARLTEMLARGLTATQIGAALGRTRNAVIGRSHRLEHAGKVLVRKRAPVKAPGARKYAPRTMANQLPQPVAAPHGRAATGILSLAEVKAAPIAKQPPAPPTGKPVSILRVTGCRWPVTDDRPHRFCNSAKGLEDSYCEYHKAIAYRDFVPSKPRREVVPVTSLRGGVQA